MHKRQWCICSRNGWTFIWCKCSLWCHVMTCCLPALGCVTAKPRFCLFVFLLCSVGDLTEFRAQQLKMFSVFHCVFCWLLLCKPSLAILLSPSPPVKNDDQAPSFRSMSSNTRYIGKNQESYDPIKRHVVHSGGGQSSGTAWKTRWPSWAPRP